MSQEKKAKPRPSRSNREQPPAAASEARPPDESRWRERAAFQVAFDQATDAEGQTIWQTRAYHEEADGRTVWPGIAGAALMTWMRERADLPAEPSAVDQPAQPPAVELPAEPSAVDQPAEQPAAELRDELFLVIDELAIETALAEQEVGGVAIAPDHLDALVRFHLSGVGASLAAASGSACLVQLLAHDLAQNHVAILALEGRQLEPELIEYSSTLSFETPPVGEYEIMALVLLPDHALSATELGPALNVVP
jgi:hypothetical protein